MEIVSKTLVKSKMSARKLDKNKSPKKDGYHHGELKETLVNTALMILKKDGYDALTMRKVSALSGVSHAAAYRHFKDKDELLAEIAVYGFKKLAACVFVKMNTTDKKLLSKAFISSGIDYVNFAIQNKELYRLMFNRNKADIAKFEHLKEAADKTFNEEISFIKTCIDNKIFKEGNPEIIAFTGWSMIHGLTMLILDGVLTEEELSVLDGSKKNSKCGNLESLITNASQLMLSGFLR